VKLSYVTTYDALDVNQWSGLGYYIAKSIARQGAEIDYVGSLVSKATIFDKIRGKSYKLIGKNFHYDREPFISEYYAEQIAARVRTDSNVIFSPGTVPIALLKTDKPKVFYTDATFAGIMNFYDRFSHLSSQTIKNGNFLEQQALTSSKLAIFSSDWAAKGAIDHYNVDPGKIKVVPFGANIESRHTLDDIKGLVRSKQGTECNLIFLGVDWKRKGADIAVEVVKELNNRGLKTTLHIAGIKELPLKQLPPYIINHGFINKSTADGKNKINQLLASGHFLIMPTQADCTPVVYSEANSFGLPVVSTDVGGIPTIVKNDINGRIFSLLNSVQDYAAYIYDVFNNNKRYEELCYSSFNEYITRLNWNVSGKLIMDYIKQL
jgi:glycosyltransferase involved in cell wall biosynthesis